MPEEIKSQKELKTPIKVISGFFILQSEDGTKFQAEVIGVTDLTIDDVYFSASVEGKLTTTKF